MTVRSPHPPHAPLALARLSRTARPRVMAPDGWRAPLDRALPLERTPSTLTRAAIALGVLGLLSSGPALMRDVAAGPLGRDASARFVEALVSQRTEGQLTIDGIDYVDGSRVLVHGVRFADAAGNEQLAIDTLALRYDAASLVAGRVVATDGQMKGGHVALRVDDTRRAGRAALPMDFVVHLDRLDGTGVSLSHDGHTPPPTALRVRVAARGRDGLAITRL